MTSLAGWGRIKNLANPLTILVNRDSLTGYETRFQVFFQSGDLLAETQLARTDAGAVLEVDDVVASFDLMLLPRYEVIYNPGAVLEAAGLLLLAVGGIMLTQSPADSGDGTGEPSTLADEES